MTEVFFAGFMFGFATGFIIGASGFDHMGVGIALGLALGLPLGLLFACDYLRSASSRDR